jgi:O-acetyl-ADP-ribose deacetylase (regulator of RNase III)
MMGKMEIFEGDITKLEVDAIVNAANESLLGGGGVDGAIHSAASPELLIECKALRGCPTSEARLTNACNLPATYIIHTVGPVWNGGNAGEDVLLASCYRRALGLTVGNNLKSGAFLAISTGVYRFPPERAARIAVEAVAEFLGRGDGPERVIFCCFGQDSVAAQEKALAALD